MHSGPARTMFYVLVRVKNERPSQLELEPRLFVSPNLRTVQLGVGRRTFE